MLVTFLSLFNSLTDAGLLLAALIDGWCFTCGMDGTPTVELLVLLWLIRT